MPYKNSTLGNISTSLHLTWKLLKFDLGHYFGKIFAQNITVALQEIYNGLVSVRR
jgi:hypothetical protein